MGEVALSISQAVFLNHPSSLSPLKLPKDLEKIIL
jgi:hypothetical protein